MGFCKFYEQYGFSLLELITVMVIIAILAATSYPIYASFHARGYRQQAEVRLLQAAVKFAEYYAAHGNYNGISMHEIIPRAKSDKLPYHFELQAIAGNHFLVAAVPTVIQQQEDAGCGTLMLDEKNERYVSGELGVNACWV